jgi:hypothetical protein
MTGLRGMIRAELARREEASIHYNPFTFVVYDKPDALTDVAAAVKAIEEEHESRSRPYRAGEVMRKGAPTIVPSIQAAVEAALEARHPRHFERARISIICYPIVTSGLRHAPVPDRVEDALPSPAGVPAPIKRADEDDAAERAARRLAALRGL